MRKAYESPKMRIEVVKTGVYGCYGGGSNDNGGDGPLGSFLGLLNPLFGWCCS